MQEANEEVCWQCGAPANPDCAYTQVFNNWSSQHADGGGYPVRRGRRQDTVRVTVPRCAACRDRSYLAGLLIVAGFIGGGMSGGLLFPPNQWTWLAGAFGGLLTVALVNILNEKRAGRRLVTSYPPLRRLRAAGWSEPN